MTVRGTDGCSSLFVAVKKGNNVQLNWPMTANAIYQILRSVRKKLALMRFLRMIFAELLPHDFLSTVPISTLSVKQLGHASVLTTQKYDKRDQSVVNEAMRDVDL